MRALIHVAGLVLAGTVASGCATHAETLTASGTPALNAPEPPNRVVVPTTEQQTLPATIDEPPSSSSPGSTTKPPVRPPNPRPAAPPPNEPPPPVATPTPAPTPAILLTSVNSPEFEKRVRDLLTVAQANLKQVSRENLGTDARAQFDAAQGFVRQAEEALKVKNLIYAGQLADKAATMAALLRK